MTEPFLPSGFSYGSVHCGIKKVAGAPDLALVLSDAPCAAAAVFTQNRYAAAPVQYDRRLLEWNPDGVQAVVINSGNANAVTGAEGMAATRRTAEAVESMFGLSPWTTLVMSTGVIGVPLPVERIEAALPDLYRRLQPGAAAFAAASQAIMTTDTRPKTAFASGIVDGETVSVAGMAKGAGMIHPNMATLLAVVVTDAAITVESLQAALRQAVNVSFNRISVDGDTSTNDTVAVLANGLAANELIAGPESAGFTAGFTAGFAAFTRLLTQVCTDLAQAIVGDGEGASKFVAITVSGLETDTDAHRVANSIAISPLVKTAIYGGDANWGRILAAAGNSGVTFAPEAAELWISGGSSAGTLLPTLQLVGNGAPLAFDEAESSLRFTQPELSIDLRLGTGPGQATVWTCDLSHDYVTINGAYRT